MVGWGYDTQLRPVPNAKLDADPALFDSNGAMVVSGAFVSPGQGEYDFLNDHLKRMDKWKAGPVDLRWDRKRKVWASAGGGDLHLGVMDRCYEYAGSQVPYTYCTNEGAPNCCLGDDFNSESNFWGGRAPEFQTCCTDKDGNGVCISKQCAQNNWQCSDCDGNPTQGIVQTKLLTSILKDASTGTWFKVENICQFPAVPFHVKIENEVIAIKAMYVEDPACNCTSTDCTGWLQIGTAISVTTQYPGRAMSAPPCNAGDVYGENNPCCTDPMCSAPGGAATCCSEAINNVWTETPCKSYYGCRMSHYGSPTNGVIVQGPSYGVYWDATVFRNGRKAPEGLAWPDYFSDLYPESSATGDKELVMLENVLAQPLKRNAHFIAWDTGRTARRWNGKYQPVPASQVIPSITTSPDPNATCCDASRWDCENPNANPLQITGQAGPKLPTCCSGGMCKNQTNGSALVNVVQQDCSGECSGTGSNCVWENRPDCGKVYDDFSVFWVLQAEFDTSQVVTNIQCNSSTFELTICTRKIATQGGRTCEYCPPSPGTYNACQNTSNFPSGGAGSGSGGNGSEPPAGGGA